MSEQYRPFREDILPVYRKCAVNRSYLWSPSHNTQSVIQRHDANGKRNQTDNPALRIYAHARRGNKFKVHVVHIHNCYLSNNRFYSLSDMVIHFSSVPVLRCDDEKGLQ